MRYAVDLAVLGAVFLLGMMVFRQPVAALMAGVIFAGAAEALLWDADRTKQ